MDNPDNVQSINSKTGLAKRAALYVGVLAFALVLLLFLSAGQASAEDVSVDITSDITWTSGSMYNVTVPITVAANATLTIENNVTVIFEPGAYLTVEGGLIVQGSAALPVVFDSNATAGTYLWGGVTFLEGATGSVDYLTIINATTGLYFQNVTVPFSNVIIQGDGSFGVFYDLIEGDWTLAVSDLTVDGASIGVFVQNGNGSLDLTLQNVDITTTGFGVNVGVGSMTDDLRTLDLSVMDSSFSGGAFGIYAYAQNGGSALLDSSEFLGQSVNAFIFDSDVGDVDVQMIDSLFDGSSAADQVVYIVNEIDYEFDLIGRQNNWAGWDEVYYGGSDNVDLPFAFNYNGVEYTTVDFEEDGYLYFGGSDYIEPVGETNLMYDGDHFFAYKIADDNSSVLFNWFAYDWYSGWGESNAFQVILYANGEIQFNFAAMDGYDYWSAPWGIWTSSYSYNLESIFGVDSWYADYSSYLFTPNAISDGLAIQVLSEVGDVTVEMTGNTITSYYTGGVYANAFDGDMTFVAMDNAISKMHSIYYSVIWALAYNGTIDGTLVNNTFDYVWGPAVVFASEGLVGGSHNIEVTDNVFTKTMYGVYTWVDVYSTDRDELVDDTLSVVANFQDNTMIDAYGLYCWVYVESYDQVNWDVMVEQSFTGNVMAQERYEGSFPFNDWYTISSDLIGTGLGVYDYEDENTTTINANHTVTITGNDIEDPIGLWNGINAGNYLENVMGDVTSVCVMTITDNVVTFSGYEAGIYAQNWIYANLGTINSDTSIVIEDNQIFDGYWNIYAIEVYVEVEGENDFEAALDLNANDYVSVVNNLVEGAYEGIYLYIDYDQDNIVGDWNVALTAHLDQNELLNVTYGVECYLYGGVWFGSNYWPYYDEVAVGNFVMDYLLTVDNNVILSLGDSYYEYDGIIYVVIEYWAEVHSSALFTEANALINGAVSVSDNEITQEWGYINAIYLDHWYGVESTGTIEVNVDLAVDDNIIDTGYNAYYAIVLWDEAYMYGNWATTDAPSVLANVMWSVSGNQITGMPEYGIAMIISNDVDTPDGTLVQNLGVDISDNTVVSYYGAIGFMVDSYPDTEGYIELNIDATIENNVLDTGYGLVTDSGHYSGLYVGPFEMGDGEPVADGIYGMDVNFNVLISGNQISGYEFGMNLMGMSEMVGALADEFVWSFDVNFMVENNYINNSYIAINAYGGNMTMTNNVIESVYRGIEWEYANGEISDNTITGYRGLELDHPYELLVQNNEITFEETGIDVWGCYEGSALQIMGNTLTGIESDMGPIFSWGTGVEIDDSDNVVVDGNVITNVYYGIYADNVYMLTISNNQITGCGEGIYLYDGYMIWIESNLVKDGGDGLVVDEYNEYIVIGNNTFADNEGYGAYIYYYDNWDITLYNNEFSGNGYYGLYAQSYDSGVMWYVDADSVVARNDVYFEGQIEIMEGGTMMVEDVDSFTIYSALIQVDEGGLLFMSNSDLYGWGYLEVYGTFWANVCLFDGFDIYLGPTSAAEIRGSAIMYYDYAAIHVDGCSPVIADNLIFSPYGMYGILVEGEGASPSIVSNIIALNNQGIYARDTDMGGIYDNIFLLNLKSGILAENATGMIHDNVFLANKIEILLRNCDVSIEDNEIGYTDLFQVLANYAPLLGHFMGTSASEEAEATSDEPLAMLESILGISDLDIWDLTSWVKGHNGIWAENSVVRTSGNTYGMLNYALYAVGSEIHFADDIVMQELIVPHVNNGVTVNYSLNIYVLNGIYASGSTLWVDGSTIEVLDDAIVLENSQAWIEGATLMAGDFDYFLFGDSEAYNIATSYDTFKVENSHSLNEGTWLTVNAMEKGEPAANVTIVIKNAKGEIVFEGVTDAEGKIRVLLSQYAWTYEGKDDGFNPYTITAYFESGNKTMDVTLNESYMDVTITGEKESDMGAILAVVGVLIIILLIVAAVVVMRRRK